MFTQTPSGPHSGGGGGDRVLLLLLAAAAAATVAAAVHSSMSCWQWGPVKPGGQEQVPGPLHSPPLSQGVGHTAETQKRREILLSRCEVDLSSDYVH
jgi:hypothetical protein